MSRGLEPPRGGIRRRAVLTVVLAGLAATGAGAREATAGGEGIVRDHDIGSLSEFESGEGAAWRAVDDVVMGGVSSSRLTVTPAGTGVFEGEVSLANNGGFASVRRRVGPFDLSGHPGIELRVRGDGRRYRLRLRTDERFDGIAWQSAFETRDGEWQVVTLPFGSFEPSFRGRRPAGAGPVDTRRIAQLGLMIADRQAGPFRLEIDWIRPQPAGR